MLIILFMNAEKAVQYKKALFYSTISSVKKIFRVVMFKRCTEVKNKFKIIYC